MFHKRVMQLILATTIAELAVAVTVWTICPPSENTWRTYFAFRRSLLPALVATGVIIGSFHAVRYAKKPFGWWLATLFVDTFGLVAAARAALAIAMQASLSIAFISRRNKAISGGGFHVHVRIDSSGSISYGILYRMVCVVYEVLLEAKTHPRLLRRGRHLLARNCRCPL